MLPLWKVEKAFGISISHFADVFWWTKFQLSFISVYIYIFFAVLNDEGQQSEFLYSFFAAFI